MKVDREGLFRSLILIIGLYLLNLLLKPLLIIQQFRDLLLHLFDLVLNLIHGVRMVTPRLKLLDLQLQLLLLLLFLLQLRLPLLLLHLLLLRHFWKHWLFLRDFDLVMRYLGGTSSTLFLLNLRNTGSIRCFFILDR